MVTLPHPLSRALGFGSGRWPSNHPLPQLWVAAGCAPTSPPPPPSVLGGGRLHPNLLPPSVSGAGSAPTATSRPSRPRTGLHQSPLPQGRFAPCEEPRALGAAGSSPAAGGWFGSGAKGTFAPLLAGRDAGGVPAGRRRTRAQRTCAAARHMLTVRGAWADAARGPSDILGRPARSGERRRRAPGREQPAAPAPPGPPALAPAAFPSPASPGLLRASLLPSCICLNSSQRQDGNAGGGKPSRWVAAAAVAPCAAGSPSRPMWPRRTTRPPAPPP